MTRKNLLKILFIEDLPSDVDLAVLELRKEKLKFEHTTVCTRVDLIKALKEFKPNLIISDYMMPAFDGLQALKEVKEFDPEIPFILCTGSVNEETAVECIKAGADDYVIKEHMTKLPFAVKEVLEQLIIKKEKRAAEQLLKESEERFRKLYNDAVVGLYRTTPRGEILLANHALVKMLGFSSFEELAARNLKSGGFGPSYSRQEFINRIEKDGMVKDLESSWIDRDNKEIFVRESAKVIYGTDKKILFYDGTVQDITEQKRAAEALYKIQHLFETLTMVSPVGIFRTDKDSNTTYVNPRYSELTGLSFEETMGRGWLNAVHPDDKEKLKERWLSDFKSQKISSAEYRFLKPDGSIVWVMGNAIPEWIDNETVGYIGTITDITERKRTEEELRDSEMRLNLALEKNLSGVWDLNLLDHTAYRTLTHDKIFGYETLLPNWTFEMFLEHVLPEDRQDVDRSFSKATATESDWSLDCRIRRTDGEVRWICATGGNVRNSEGKSVRMSGLVQDITERKRTEEALRESEEKFRSIMENSADAIFITDQQGKYLYTNKAVTAMLGFTSEEMKSKTIIDITPKNETEQYLEIFNQALRKGKVFAEIELLKKDGNFISTDLNSVLLPGGLVYGSCRDITERKVIENELLKHRDHLEELVNERTEELRMAKREAEDANKAKSEFLANMSHEIRTPMNAVLGYTELLSSTLVNQTQKDYINSIKSSGRSLLTLIDDILDLSKIEAGKLELEYDYVDTYSFFSEFERIFSLKVSEKGLKFILDITSGTPAGIYIDEARVRQIVFNLLGNAIKFTSEGKIILKVFTENPQIMNYSKEKSEELIDLIIEVQDTGIGISKKLKEAIFEPFVQERNYKHYGGTGLGLAITRRLTTLMDGTIHVKSEPGKGSIFTVRIPEITYLRDFSKTTVDIQIDPAEIVFEKASILIADDVEHNRSYLRDALKNTSLKIIEAEDGIAAYKLAKEIVPDLIIADIRMPKMDGFQLLNKIKTDKKLKHIPVIAYSASVLQSQKERIHKSEFIGLLIKPVKITELYLELMNYLPFRSTREAKPEKPLSEVDLMGEITNLPGLIHSLKTGFYATWKTFAIRQPIGEIRDFGKNLIQLGVDHNSSIITGYGKELISAADGFNIEAILKLIGQYKGIIESLKDSTKKLKND